MDFTDTDNVYFYDRLNNDLQNDASDQFRIKEQHGVDKGVLPYREPYHAKFHHDLYSATIYADPDYT